MALDRRRQEPRRAARYPGEPEVYDSHPGITRRSTRRPAGPSPTPSRPSGTSRYFCSNHSNMQGTVTVRAAPSATVEQRPAAARRAPAGPAREAQGLHQPAELQDPDPAAAAARACSRRGQGHPQRAAGPGQPDGDGRFTAPVDLRGFSTGTYEVQINATHRRRPHADAARAGTARARRSWQAPRCRPCSLAERVIDLTGGPVETRASAFLAEIGYPCDLVVNVESQSPGTARAAAQEVEADVRAALLRLLDEGKTVQGPDRRRAGARRRPVAHGLLLLLSRARARSDGGARPRWPRRRTAEADRWWHGEGPPEELVRVALEGIVGRLPAARGAAAHGRRGHDVRPRVRGLLQRR